MNRANSMLCRFAFVLFGLPRAALAGWFEVENYVGTIGASPVHISLQSYKHLGHAHRPSAASFSGIFGNGAQGIGSAPSALPNVDFR